MALTIADLDNAKRDLDTIRDVATSLSPTAVDRFGTVKQTLAAAIESIRTINIRGNWASATLYAVKDVVLSSSTWWICVVAHTSGATFAGDQDSKWRIYQGLTAADFANITDPTKGGGAIRFTNAPYVSGSLGKFLQNFGIDPTMEPYNADPTGATDAGPAILAAVLAHPGMRINLPPGRFLILTSVAALIDAGVDFFAPGPRIRGAGEGVTIIDCQVANGFAFDFDVVTSVSDPHATLGSEVSGMTIITSASAAASGGVRIRGCYNNVISRIEIQGLSGDGLRVTMNLGDADGSNMLDWSEIRISDCAGWGINFDAGVHNEISFTRMQQVFVQNCGTAEQRSITGISKASSGVVSCAGHGFTNGQVLRIEGVGGMTQVNGRRVTVSAATTNTFALTGVDTTAFSTYTSGGHAFPVEPSSGGIRWKGQVALFDNCATTINKNVNYFVRGGSGLPSDVTFLNTTSENPQMIGYLVTGCRQMSFISSHIYSNSTQAGGATYYGLLLDGTDSVISNIDARMTVRATSAEPNYTAFCAMGSNADRDSIRIRSTHWKQYDNTAGQVRFSGIQFDGIAQQCDLAVLGPNDVRVRPVGRGNKMAVRLSGPTDGAGLGVPSSSGEFVPRSVPSGGVSKSNAGLPAAAAKYYVYLYDNLGALALDISATAPALDVDHGYQLKAGAPERIYVGAIATDAGGAFLTSGTGYLNPTLVPGSQIGLYHREWYDASGAKRHKYNADPTTDTDGTLV